MKPVNTLLAKDYEVQNIKRVIALPLRGRGEETMTAKEWDTLQKGDRVLAFNGKYTQYGIVDDKWKDAKGMRWVKYHWFLRGVFQNWASKRYMSLYIDTHDYSPDYYNPDSRCSSRQMDGSSLIGR